MSDSLNCYEARLHLGLKSDNSAIIGSLDGVHIKPINLRDPIKTHESNTTLKYDPNLRAIVYENERYKNGNGSADFITSKQLLAGASLEEVGSVGTFVDGGIATIVEEDGRLVLNFNTPIPIGPTETSEGFLTYVANAVDGVSIKTISPDIGGESDTVLLGKPDGSIQFSTPIETPLTVPTGNLTNGGVFNGTPSTSSGTWRYQQMGESQVITNTSGSRVEVQFSFRASLQTAGSRSGIYASLVDGGTDFKTVFVENQNNIKQEGYPGAYGQWVVILEPGQRCQIRFGAWTNASGGMECTIGSVDESAGTTIQRVQRPILNIRRLV